MDRESSNAEKSPTDKDRPKNWEESIRRAVERSEQEKTDYMLVEIPEDDTITWEEPCAES